VKTHPVLEQPLCSIKKSATIQLQTRKDHNAVLTKNPDNSQRL